MINRDLFKLSFLFIVLAELLSFFGWLVPSFNVVVFFVILFLTLVLSLKKLEYGIYVLLAELFIGSKGYFFSFEAGETIISIRIGLFLVVMGVWGAGVILRSLKNDEGSRGIWRALLNLNLSKNYLLLGIVILWGFIWGIIRSNNFGDVFLDFNNWLYFLLALPIFWVVKCRDVIYDVSGDAMNRVSTKDEFIKNTLSVLAAAVTWLAIKSLILVYIFSNQFSWALPEIYKWVRDTGVGEITLVSGNFWRIFMQSQIFALLLFFILLMQKKKNILLISCIAIILISFSRSFWVGFVIGLALYFILLIIQKIRLLEFFKKFAKIMLLVFLSFCLVFIVLFLPPQTKDINLGKLVGERTTQPEAASSSRINQLEPLLKEIIKHPLFGSGFGTRVTYKTDDPRIVPATAGQTGEFSTYAFEWGYLDMILKFGLVGMIVYLILIYQILRRLVNNKFQITNDKLMSNVKGQMLNVYFGFAFAIAALLIVNIFSPYLNHPLGIGFIVISSLIFQDYEK